MYHDHKMSSEMQACIEACLRCHSVCLGMASHHCLEAGGEHVEPMHFRLMLACAETCKSAANLMLIGSGHSDHHKAMCRVCADVCEACAQSCERLGDMQDCVDACRHCADSCRRMAA